jgi:uncharacterized membrane protein YfcA
VTGPLITEIVMIGAGIGAGVFGSLLGLGGGVLIVPILTLGFGMGVRDAAGVSLVAVIVTSSAAASVYLQRHTANLRLGMSLELFTAIGALVGVLVAFSLSDKILAGLFAILLAYTGITMARRKDPRPAPAPATPAADPTSLAAGTGAAADPGVAEPPIVVAEKKTAVPGPERGPFGLWTSATLERLSGPGYHVRHLGRGIVGAFFAGIVSAILGVGGGIVKVPVMHLVMGVPLRIATATSNLMIGVTGTASAIAYLLRGGLDPYVAAPIAAGVFIGATLGSRIAPRVDLRLLRMLFIVVMAYTSIQMIIRAVSG